MPKRFIKIDIRIQYLCIYFGHIGIFQICNNVIRLQDTPEVINIIARTYQSFYGVYDSIILGRLFDV